MHAFGVVRDSDDLDRAIAFVIGGGENCAIPMATTGLPRGTSPSLAVCRMACLCRGGAIA